MSRSEDPVYYRPGPAGLLLLAASIASAAAATLRAFGTGGIDVRSAALLGLSLAAAAVPVYRMIREGGGKATGRRRLLLTVFAAHLVGTLFFFPPEDLLNDRPVITLDHAIHYYQVERAARVFPERMRLHAYDPYFMAGFPGGTVFDIDMKGAELWCSAVPLIGTARLLKLFIAAGYLLLVVSLYLGSRMLGFRFDESFAGLLVFLAFWHWGRPYAGHFRYAGMFAFLAVSHLSLLVAGLFRRFLERRSVLFFVVGPLAFLVHPTAAVLLPVPFIAAFIAARRTVPAGPAHRRWERRVLAGLVAWSALVLIANAVWLLPLYRYIDIKVTSQAFFQVAGIRALAGILLKPGNLPALLLLALSAAGSVSLLRAGRGGEAAVPLSSCLFLLFLASHGVYIPGIDQMEPGRFLVPALVFATPLAGAGLRGAMRTWSSLAGTRGGTAAAAPAAILALLLSVPVLSMIESREYYRHTLDTTPTAQVEELVEVLVERTGPSGRLMVEDGPAWKYGDSFYPSLIPLHTGVGQVGGPYPFAFIKHNFTNFHSCWAMGTDLPEMDAGRFLEYVEMYNIRWAVTSTAECREYFESTLGSDLLWSSDDFALFGIEGGNGFSFERGVEASSSYDRIDVRVPPEAAPAGAEGIVLKYHWDRGLKVDPPAMITPVRVLDDPVPMILLKTGGMSDITIRYE